MAIQIKAVLFSLFIWILIDPDDSYQMNESVWKQNHMNHLSSKLENQNTETGVRKQIVIGWTVMATA